MYYYIQIEPNNPLEAVISNPDYGNEIDRIIGHLEAISEIFGIQWKLCMKDDLLHFSFLATPRTLRVLKEKGYECRK